MRKHVTILFLMLFLIEASQSATVHGKITVEKNSKNGIAEAKVFLVPISGGQNSDTVVTDLNGDYKLDSIGIAVYALTVMHASYKTNAEIVNVTQSKSSYNVDISLTKGNGFLKGTVTDSATTKGVANAHVILLQSLTNGGDVIDSIITDTSGKYFFPKYQAEVHIELRSKPNCI